MGKRKNAAKREQRPSKEAQPIDLRRLRTKSLYERKEIVRSGLFGKPTCPDEGVEAFLDGLPDILAARKLREVAGALCLARREGRPIVMAIGAHVVKCGLNPFLIDMMERGYITALAMNGAGAIHDLEVALKGSTSEDVAAALEDGSFGTARETAEAIGRAAKAAARQGRGLGKAIGRLINSSRAPTQSGSTSSVDVCCDGGRRPPQSMKSDRVARAPNRHLSLLAEADRLGLPATVHVAIGTDTVHMHPCVSPSDLGRASHDDFRIICDVVSRLEGGVWLNVGSAVILPEVFLKALTVARNLGHRVKKFTTVNMDMLRQYRPLTNVLARPGGRAYDMIGHHELMIPLLRMAALVEEDKKGEP